VRKRTASGSDHRARARHSLNTTLMNLLRALRSNKFFGSLRVASLPLRCSPASSASSAVDSQRPSKRNRRGRRGRGGVHSGNALLPLSIKNSIVRFGNDTPFFFNLAKQKHHLKRTVEPDHNRFISGGIPLNQLTR